MPRSPLSTCLPHWARAARVEGGCVRLQPAGRGWRWDSLVQVAASLPEGRRQQRPQQLLTTGRGRTRKGWFGCLAVSGQERAPLPDVSLTNRRPPWRASRLSASSPRVPDSAKPHLRHGLLPLRPGGSEWYHSPFIGPRQTLIILIAYPPN